MSQAEQDQGLTLRDKLLRDTFTPAETFLSCLILVSSVAVLYPGQPRSYWLLGFFLIAGALTPMLLKTHETTHPFFVDSLWSRFFWLTAPFWLLLLCFVAGLLQSPLESIQLEGNSYKRLLPVNIWQPTTTGALSSWLPLLAFGCILMLGSTMFIIPKSLSYFERILPWLCLTASMACIFGYMQQIGGRTAPFYAREHASGDFFSSFAYDGHWAAYALLWMSVCFCFALRHLQYAKHYPVSKTIAPWYLSGALLLGYSGLFIEARLPAALLLLYFAALTILYTVAYLRRPGNRRRIATGAAAALLASVAAGNAILRLIQPQPADVTAEALRASAWRMFLENPLFGWGMDAFPHLSGYFQSDLLLGQPQGRAFSDILQMLAEFGVAGVLPMVVAISWLLIRYFRGRHDFLFPNILLVACLGVFLLSWMDSPFMSPAVFYSFLILFFSALRWADLSRKNVDEVDARTVLVTDSKLRRVPVYKGPKNESFK